MKKHTFNLVLALLVIVSAITALSYSGGPVADASVIVGNDYKSTEVSSSTASTTPIVIKAGVGSLGSIIIASSTANAPFAIYDNAVATSSATSTRIATFPKNAPAGTYTFDREIQRGIVVDAIPGFNGSYVVTYR